MKSNNCPYGCGNPNCKVTLTSALSTHKKVKKMKSDFKLVGLSRKKSATCEPLNNENIFWTKVALTQDRFDALWNYCNENWNDKKIAEIEHEGMYDDGTPINGVLVNVREYDLK